MTKNEILREPIRHLYHETKDSMISTVSKAKSNIAEFLGSGKTLNVVITEKMDGMTLGVGIDSQGFFMRTSCSPKYRNIFSINSASFTEGLELHFEVLRNVFRYFQNNTSLIIYLSRLRDCYKIETFELTGELFWKDFGLIGNDQTITFIKTPYWLMMQDLGMFVVYSQLNPHFDVYEYVNHQENIHSGLDFRSDFVGNLRFTKKAEWADRLNEIADDIKLRSHPDWPKVVSLAQDISKAFVEKLPIVKNGMFGPWPEGYVVHGPNNTRYKIINPKWEGITL